MPSYTVINTVNHPLSRTADFIIHKHGCKDTLKRNIFPNMLFTVRGWSAAEAAEKFRRDFYSDFEPESQDMFACKIMPCCKDIEGGRDHDFTAAELAEWDVDPDEPYDAATQKIKRDRAIDKVGSELEGIDIDAAVEQARLRARPSRRNDQPDFGSPYPEHHAADDRAERGQNFASPYECGCKEIGSKIVGVLWAGDGTEIQRCDTHSPAPIYVSDAHAAKAVKTAGYRVRRGQSDDGRRAFYGFDRKGQENR